MCISKNDLVTKSNGCYEYNHLYELSNDNIEVGDWFFCTDKTNYEFIFKCIGLTDDTHLKVKNGLGIGEYYNYFDNEFDLIENPYGDWNLCYSYKIVKTTDKALNLPLFSDDEVKLFIETYNKNLK